MNIHRPLSSELNDYFKKYIDLAPNVNYFEALDRNTKKTLFFFERIPLEKQNYKYQDNKWTIKDVFKHIIDHECVFAYRIMRSLHQDPMPFANMDEDFFASRFDLTDKPMLELLKEFDIARMHTLSIINSVPHDHITFMANGPEYTISTRALCYLVIGHVYHHLEVIKERYL